MSRHDLVSVIIPAYRAEDTIGRCLESVVAQACVAEVIVVEDGITDGTGSVVQKFPSVTHVINERNLGAPAARNRGRKHATGRYLYFLDADDWLEGAALKGAITESECNQADLCFMPWAYDGKAAKSELQLRKPSRLSAAGWFLTWTLGRDYGEFVPPVAIIWLSEFFDRVGWWDEDILKGQDSNLMFRAFCHNPKIAYSNSGRGIYWQHASVHRITSASMLSFLECQHKTRRSLAALMEINPQEVWVRIGLAQMCYLHARWGYKCGNFESGDAWYYWAKYYGFERKHIGSVMHRLACRLLGLKRKELISASLHRLRSFVQNHFGEFKSAILA